MWRITFALGLLAYMQTQVFAKGWITHVSSAGNYTAQFPSKPKETSITIVTDAGELKVVTESISENSKLLLSVTVVDYPPRFSLVDKATLLTAVRDGLKTKESKLVRDTDTGTGRDVIIQHGKYTMRTKLMLVGVRLYQVSVTGSPEQVDGKLAAQFLDSFVPGK